LDKPFSRYENLNFFSIWLKNAYSGPKNGGFWGLRPLKYFDPWSAPPKGTSVAGFASFEPLLAEIRQVLFAVGDIKNKREGKGRKGKGNQMCYISPINVKHLAVYMIL
jgi:hypothetical protein